MISVMLTAIYKNSNSLHTKTKQIVEAADST